MKKSTKKGFTLVELVIVIAVIAILSAILIPTFGNVISNANETKYQSGAKAGYEEMLVDQLEDHPEVGEMKALVIYKEGDKVVRAYESANGELKAVENVASTGKTYGTGDAAVTVKYNGKNVALTKGSTDVEFADTNKMTETTTIDLGTAYYVATNVYIIFYEKA